MLGSVLFTYFPDWAVVLQASSFFKKIAAVLFPDPIPPVIPSLNIFI